MIKTLRITSILAAALAITIVGFFVFRIVYGVQSDEKIKDFLSSPGVIEKFKKAEGNRSKTSSGQNPPLVQQAQAFSLYLNPPVSKNTQVGRNATNISAQLKTTPKFPVIGISYYEGRPEMSMALIDEPGKGIHWVKQSTTVGHFFIEQIKNDLVIVKSGTETFKLAAEREPSNSKSPPQSNSSSVSKKPDNTVTSRIRTPLPSRSRSIISRTPTKSPQPQENTDKSEKLEELYSKLKDIQISSDKTDSELSEEERAKQIENIISNFKTSYVSPEEAEKLENLGEQLKNLKGEPNSAKLDD